MRSPIPAWMCLGVALAACDTTVPFDDSGSATGTDEQDDTGVGGDAGDGGGEEGGDVGGTDDGGGEEGGGDEGGGDEGSGDEGSGDEGGDDGTEEPEAQDYRQTGPSSVSTESVSESVDGGCTISGTRYVPSDPILDTTVIVSHGFARSSANMTEHGEHLASWGLDTMVVDLCHASIWDTDHAQNGVDLATFADKLGLVGVIYIGQSAGGLASVLAAAEDSDTLAVVGLDGVDSDGLGTAALSKVSAPLYGLVGESSSCNASNNGATWYASGSALRVTEADHCDFEAPTDLLCTLVCTGSNDQFTDAELLSTVQGLMTAAALDAAGQTEAGDGWWSSGGTYYDELLTDGAIDPL